MYRVFGLYRGVWHFASLPDLLRIGKTSLSGTLLAVFAAFLLVRMEAVPRSVFPLYGVLIILLLGGARFCYRWFKDRKLYTIAGEPVLIIGAGRAGDMLVRELLRDHEHRYLPIAFLDDDPNKIKREMHGLPIVGNIDDLADIVNDFAIDMVIIAIPSATAKQMRRIVTLCEHSEIPFRMLPKIQDLVLEKTILEEIKEVAIEDLLGRDTVTLDWQSIKSALCGNTILVTGSGGSIGAELCRQITRLNPAALILFERSEYHLFMIEQELRHKIPDLKLHTVLGDVCDRTAVVDVMQKFKPKMVFHAAAYKHVSMLQEQLRQAMQNNVLGTRILTQVADQFGVAVFVLISTDKAVNPTNVMGASKRIAELICQNMDRHSSTRFVTVRFGNVLGSAGSVVPIFNDQIRRGGPVTVTHPEVSRYFMTIPEACQLIMQAATQGQGGEIFVLNMGESVKIATLAEQMIKLAGKHAENTVKIKYIGLRPGEKLYEELFHEQESLQKTKHAKILLADYRKVDWQNLNKALDDIDNACQINDIAQLHTLLNTLVPEFNSEHETHPILNKNVTQKLAVN